MAQAQRLQALLDLSRALSSSLDLREVLREFATHAAQLTGATAAELSTYDPARGELVMLVEYREGRDEITASGGQVYHLADFPATRHVLDTQEPVQVRVENPDDDAAERALLERQGQKSLLMLPLVARGETIGLMEIVDTQDRVWNEADVGFCRALCDIVATAIRNAVLFAELQETAARDMLTGLYNRRLFEEQLEAAVARSLRTREDLALLIVDLDGLKRINDVSGHVAGDQALRTLADALRATIRATDVACRLGGDEFGVILPGSSAEDAVKVAERAQETLAQIGHGQFSFSGGIARVTPLAVLGGERLPLGRPRRLPGEGGRAALARCSRSRRERPRPVSRSRPARPSRGGALEVEKVVGVVDQQRVVGGADDGGAGLPREAEEQPGDRERVRLVETRGRLVGEQERRAACEGAGDGHSLALAARQVRHPAAGRACEADRGERLGSARPRLAPPRCRGGRGPARRSRQPSGTGRARSPG